ncbi:adenylate/guanylate cyclase domain-containing protein [Ramlibacter rhizophilus]|uniref:Adenylate/guanylate cyclase domain-containing protein n=1 Tax=Ramlibacter rhizophilus TaxID=1781167 RepID=A0A4Z0BWB8_9BURK|nr:adenylate/guanylate cyclase domain-containing protein [Ramlibacter rhizophilus]TFZ03201.1 adenylate/guanylate cyclase domain-containing protein [Ramlibacter rhizophilus]
MAPSPFSTACNRRDLLCTILFVDLVGYTMLPVDGQVAAKHAMNRLVARAIHGVPRRNRLAIDTGDGAAICFIADPQQTLEAAVVLRGLLQRLHHPRLRARIGLHLGFVRIVPDINDHKNVVGDGINVAQRIMDFAQPDQILVSSPFRSLLLRTGELGPGACVSLGRLRDKHGRAHEVHRLALERIDRWSCRESGGDRAHPDGDGKEAERQRIAIELTGLVGPIAPILVARLAERGATPAQMRQWLAELLPDPAVRRAFLGDASGGVHPGPAAGPKGAGEARPLHEVAPRPRPRRARAAPAAVAPSTVAKSPAPRARRAAPARPEPLDRLESVLGRFIGPLARATLERALSAGLRGPELVAALAEQLPEGPDREGFLRAVAREL